MWKKIKNKKYPKNNLNNYIRSLNQKIENKNKNKKINKRIIVNT